MNHKAEARRLFSCRLMQDSEFLRELEWALDQALNETTQPKGIITWLKEQVKLMLK